MTGETCDRCGRPVDNHLVGEWRRCLADLHSHDLPYQETDQPVAQNLDVFMAGSVAVKGGTIAAPETGPVPVLVFEFTGPAGQQTTQLPPVALVLDDTKMRSIGQIVGDAARGAVTAARRQRN